MTFGRNVIVVDAIIGKQVNLTCPNHSYEEGQIYYWGTLPDQGRPILWGNGDQDGLMFIGDKGQLIFSYLTKDQVMMINRLNGISCILYQSHATRPSVRFKINSVGEGNPIVSSS